MSSGPHGPIFNVGMPQIFLVIESVHPFEKFCLWALMIAINVSVAIANSSILFIWKMVYCRLQQPVGNQHESREIPQKEFIVL